MIEQNDEIIRLLARLVERQGDPVQKAKPPKGKLKEAILYLQARPEKQGLSSRQLAAQVERPKFGKSLWAEAKKHVSAVSADSTDR
jgi:hypothetical protein